MQANRLAKLIKTKGIYAERNVKKILLSEGAVKRAKIDLACHKESMPSLALFNILLLKNSQEKIRISMVTCSQKLSLLMADAG